VKRFSEVNAIAQEYPTINQAMQELAESAKAETTPQFVEVLNQKIDEIEAALKSQQPSKVEIETQVTGGFYQPNWTVNS
jgi:flagellar hook-basal body complex protein FliE